MNSCKITIQRKAGEQWPVVLEQKAAEGSLEIRSEGLLSLDLQVLATQVTPHDYGMMLGQALFQGTVREAFVHARAQSNDQLSVQLLVEAPDLSTLRWERLCAPLDEHWHFLAHDQRAPFSLAPSSPSTRRFPQLRRENLRALVLVASPQGLERYRLSPFHVEATVGSIRAAFGPIPCDVLSTTPDAVGPPTLDALCERLSSTSYSLLHVVCHGRYSSDISDTIIYLANEEQQVDPVTGQRLITRLSQVRGEQGLPQFAFLATCESASPEAEGVLGGLAQSLVRDLGMPAVLAMTEPVSISTVDAVTSQFYRRLVAHGQVDLALAEACAGVAERADSLVPALYSRLGARPLFEQQALAVHQQPLSLTHQQRKQNRSRMLERVQRIWISGVLEQSLHGVALLSLGLQEQSDAVTNPWRLVMQEAEQPARSLPSGTRITQVYDDADHELLILGAPGAGKTTLLLALTRDLLQRAKQDDTHPIPVVFHLSSWAVKRQPLKQWLMEELNLKYQVPHKLAHDWIETDQVLPLLDGLDEVKVDARPACIETINTYHQEHGFLPLVVASRSADYLAQTTRLRLTSAVTIQLLTQQQVNIYLASGGEPLSALKVALQQDAALRELAETPLMLSILTLTYHDMPVEDLLQEGIAPTRQQIFEHYVERMLKRRGAKASYQPEQTRGWLTWLAKQLIQQGQTVFYIERLQPDWASKNRRQRILSALITGSVCVLLFGLFSVLIFGPAGLLFGSQHYLQYQTVSVGETCTGNSCSKVSNYRKVWQGPNGTVQGGVTFALLFGFLSVLIGAVISLRKRSIQPVEVVRWQWTGRWRRLLLGLLIGLGLGVLIGELLVLLSVLIFVLLEVQSSPLSFEQVITGYEHQNAIGIFFRLKDTLLFSTMGLLLGGVISRTSSELMDENMHHTPSEGIWRSARYAFLSGVIVMLVSGVSIGFSIDPLLGLCFGLVVGVITGLSNGGIACIQHLLLRVRLRFERVIPWNYPRFLDYAAEHILLRKVGGGYIFVHRLLLEYFASLDTTPTFDATRASKQQEERAF